MCMITITYYDSIQPHSLPPCSLEAVSGLRKGRQPATSYMHVGRRRHCTLQSITKLWGRFRQETITNDPAAFADSRSTSRLPDLQVSSTDDSLLPLHILDHCAASPLTRTSKCRSPYVMRNAALRPSAQSVTSKYKPGRVCLQPQNAVYPSLLDLPSYDQKIPSIAQSRTLEIS